MTKQPVCTAPSMVCAYCQNTHLLNTSDQKSASSIWPWESMRWPVGYCIQALVATMKYPESHEPSQTRKAAHQWPMRPSLFSPNKSKPRKVDSRKNEKMPSIANVWPITPPAALEKAAQFVPN